MNPISPPTARGRWYSRTAWCCPITPINGCTRPRKPSPRDCEDDDHNQGDGNHVFTQAIRGGGRASSLRDSDSRTGTGGGAAGWTHRSGGGSGDGVRGADAGPAELRRADAGVPRHHRTRRVERDASAVPFDARRNRSRRGRLARVRAQGRPEQSELHLPALPERGPVLQRDRRLDAGAGTWLDASRKARRVISRRTTNDLSSFSSRASESRILRRLRMTRTQEHQEGISLDTPRILRRLRMTRTQEHQE